MLRNKCILAVGWLALATPALGQNLYQDIQREFADENQLQRDVRRYQYDIANGNYLRTAADRARIQNDESNIRYDQALVQNDLAYTSIGSNAYQGQSLLPHPQYPGYYYYPSQPAQLYYYPATQPQVSASPTFVGPPATLAASNGAVATVNPVTYNVPPPSRSITVSISNPADSGVAINFAVDGTAYSVPSGYTQKLPATTSSVVEFDRGELFGDARYSLSDGTYQFRYTDRGWELYKTKSNPLTASTSTLPRNTQPRSIASAATPGLAPMTGPASPTADTSLTPTTPKETVPPPPVPDPSTPR